MEDQDHKRVYFSIDEDGDIDFDDTYGNSCDDLKLVHESDKITWDEVEARLRSYSKEHQQELQYHLKECFQRLPKMCIRDRYRTYLMKHTERAAEPWMSS